MIYRAQFYQKGRPCRTVTFGAKDRLKANEIASWHVGVDEDAIWTLEEVKDKFPPPLQIPLSLES